MITNANELQDAIARQGVSLAELARHLDVRHDVVSKMKTGKRRINAEESRRLTAFFAAMEDPKSDGFALDSIEDAIADIAAGKLIVVVDDADRENEGDLVMAASRVTTEAMAMMIRAGGLVCAPVTAENAVRLRLNPMAQNNDAPLATAFTVSIDYREGLTTGISAHERANTVRALSNNNVQAEDFVRPGHIFPLVAKDGGVLIRSGHTEAAVDLAHLAGEPPAGLICEILGEDGATLKGEGLAEYARVNGLKMVSIADLIAYRQQREQLVTRLSEFETQTRIGAAQAHIYSTPFDAEQHIAMVFGTPDPASPVLVRLHRETPLEDVFGSSGSSMNKVLDQIAADGAGVVVFLREHAVGVTPTLDAWAGETESEHQRQTNWREVGLGAQILRDLGIRSIRLLSSRERQYVGLSGFGIEIAETVLLP